MTATNQLPLLGVRILDFSALLPGPYASRLLADMGAEVVRLESPDRLDLIRIMPPIKQRKSVIDSYLNKGKRSVALNLKDPEMMALVKRSVKDFDVVIEQFRPGVMKKLGLSYDDLIQNNPALIYCSITGYGQTGPLSHKAGHDINYLALAGCVDYSRRKDQRPVPYSIQVADIAGGSHHAVMSILAALYQRSATQKGSYLDISMSDAALSMNVMSASASLNGDDVGPQSQILNAKSYYDFYTTKDGRYFSVGSLEPKFIKGLCVVIGRPELVSMAISQRQQDIAEFKRILEDYFVTRSFEDLSDIFSGQDLCVEPVLSLSQALSHPHFISRGMIVPGVCRADVKSALPFYSPLDTNHLKSEDCGESTHWFLSGYGIDSQKIIKLKNRRAIK